MTGTQPARPIRDRRSLSAPSLPGGSSGQRERLIEFLEHVDGRIQSSWLNDGEQLKAAQQQLGSLRLTETREGSVALTERGRDWLSRQDDRELFGLLHETTEYFGEMLERLQGDGARVEDLLEDAATRFQLNWNSADQVRRRLSWLHVLGMAEHGPNRLHRITEAGRGALSEIDLAVPFSVSQSRNEALEPPPAQLAQLLKQIDHGKRRVPMGYLSKDPLTALRRIVELTEQPIARDALVGKLGAEFGIKDSSVEGLLSASRAMGLHHYTGRDLISSTGLGREWSSNATPLNLVRLMHAAFASFGEALIHMGAEPKSSGEVHRALFPLPSAPNQNRTAAVLRRLAEAELISEIGYARFVITPRGESLRRELPLNAIAPGDPESVQESTQEPTKTSPFEVADELLQAGTDTATPSRLETATAAVFRALGVEAEHLGNPGTTDVLLTIRSNLEVLARIVVDTKAAASGQLREDSVVIDTLKEHAAKYRADRIAVVAPGYDHAGRLPARAMSNSIRLLTTDELASVLRDHTRIPYSPHDVLDLLSVDGAEGLLARRQTASDELALITQVLAELLSEAEQSNAEPITARDIYRNIRKESDTSEKRVAEILEFLSDPRVRVVERTKDNAYTLPATLQVAALRLRSLADAIEAAGIAATGR